MSTALVDLNALTANLEAVRAQLRPGTLVMPAIKADAYGHGAVRVARTLEQAGVTRLAVATAPELLELREAGVTCDIMLLTPALDMINELADAGAIFTVSDDFALARLLRARVPKGTRVHLKVDTGLNRIGLPPEHAVELARRITDSQMLELEGVFTHFVAAEDDPAMTARQLERFEWTLSALAKDGITPALRHTCNSAGIFNHPEAHYDMVRPGIVMYGYAPVPGMEVQARLSKVLHLIAPVISCKRVSAGTGVSYNHLWHAPSDTNILTIRCGYADGYRRLLSNRSWASLHGHRVEVRGRIAMDQMMLDSGDLTAEPGELVTLIGDPGPGADELGTLAETNAYDILSSLTRRVYRQYVRGNPANG